VKNPLEFNEIFSLSASAFLSGWRLSLKGWGSPSIQPRSRRQLATVLWTLQTCELASSARHPTPREMLGTARCGPRELRGPHLVPLLIRSRGGWLYASVNFCCGHNLRQ